MNILFLMKVFEVGGQEVVTATLAQCFTEHKHNVVIATFKEPSPIMKKRIAEKIKIYTIGDFCYSNSNVDTLKKILIDEKINVIINQWGLPYVSAKIVKNAVKDLNIKIIAVYHNSPDSNARIKDVEIAFTQTSNWLKRKLLQGQKIIFEWITGKSMHYVYRQSDYYMLLSPSFIEKFKTFTGIKKATKLLVQTNPVTIDSSDFKLNFIQKQKEILYVGRIDYNQKRVYRIIDTWALLEKEYPDWQLTIVGDGIERTNLEEKARILDLKHITFEGFQEPKPYYERASILMLTSEYEGFPLVLAECMSFGVVPAVYGSYSAVYDIITDNDDGIILPYNKDGFQAKQMAERLSPIMEQPELYQKMAIAAKEKSENYSLDTIYQSWNSLFNKLSEI